MGSSTGSVICRGVFAYVPSMASWFDQVAGTTQVALLAVEVKNDGTSHDRARDPRLRLGGMIRESLKCVPFRTGPASITKPFR